MTVIFYFISYLNLDAIILKDLFEEKFNLAIILICHYESLDCR